MATPKTASAAAYFWNLPEETREDIVSGVYYRRDILRILQPFLTDEGATMVCDWLEGKSA